MSIYFLGIDQTGARDHKGQPRPLPACLIFEDKIYFFYLKTLSKSEISQELKSLFSKREEITVKSSQSDLALSQIFICLDCVIGLPKSLGLKWREAVKKTFEETGFGREAARIFFEKLLAQNHISKVAKNLSRRPSTRAKDPLDQITFPRRECEIRLKANSVFQTHPFQKNIQTGTFRFWKELAQSPNDFYAPAIENLPTRFRSKRHEADQPIPIFEGYPSHSWRALFGVKARNAEKLTELMQARFPHLKWTNSQQAQVNRDSNLGDALVLALTLLELKNELKKEPNFNITKNSEGFILSERLSK